MAHGNDRRARPGWAPAAVFAVLGAAAPVHGAAAPIPVEDLVRSFSPAFGYLLSPDGRYVLRSHPASPRWKLYPVDDRGGVGEPAAFDRDGLRLPFWTRDGSRLHAIEYRDRTPVLVAIDPARPGSKWRKTPLSGGAGQVVSASANRSGEERVLLRTRGRDGERVFHCAADGGGVCERVAPETEGAHPWMWFLDDSGQAVARSRFAGEDYEFQARRGEHWEHSGQMEVDRIFVPLAPPGPDGWGLALSNRTRDTMSLVRWHAPTMEERVVHSEPDAGLRSVSLSPDHRPLAAVSFPGYPRTTALDPAVERALELVRSRHPAPALMDVASADRALERFVVVVFDEIRARAAYLVVPSRDAVAEIDASPLGRRFGERFSATRAFRVRARDGLMLPVLLTSPRRPEGAAPPPLVLMAHGGPWASYLWTFDPLAQLFASRGYAVLKVNYRGSAGYGNRFQEAAFGELAGRVLDDLEDAFEWAVREGHGDRERLAMFGDSFGGFCILATLVRGRLPVRAGVLLNGVVDTEAMLDEHTFPPPSQLQWAKYFGARDAGEMRRILRAASPLPQEDRIEAPLLFFTGNADRIVQARHAADLAGRLRALGREARHVGFPGEGHSISGRGNVVEMYREMAAFLERHLGRPAGN